MPSALTTHFGLRHYADDAVIHMPQGLPGFESETGFVALQVDGQYPLVYLQSTRTPDLCFVALPVLSVDGAYLLKLREEDSEILGLDLAPRIGRDVLCLTLIAIEGHEATANLLAPVVINLTSRIAAQCVNMRGCYSDRHSLHAVREAAPA